MNLYNARKAAELLGITKIAVNKAIGRGTLKAEMPGTEWLITPEAIEDYRKNHLRVPKSKRR
jgi:excisionase family DNA binding protein